MQWDWTIKVSRLSLASIALTVLSNPAGADAQAQALFQNRFFSLSQDNSLLCATSEQAYLPIPVLQQTLAFYEQGHPQLRAQAVAVLTDHHHPEHLNDLAEYREECQTTADPSLCLLEHYWDNREAALRTLALFYDTKTVIKHSDDYELPHFKVDHVRIFEKAIRKIPPHLRQRISKAKPNEHLQEAIANKPSVIQALILDAFPEDYRTSIWDDHTHPLTLVPGYGFRSKTVAQVFSGQNLIVFTIKAFDKGKDGRAYRDIGVQYQVDFRLPIVVHEIAHTIDNFQFWNGVDELYFFYQYKKISNAQETAQIIAEAKLALWPSKWFEAFEALWEVNEGRYDGNTQEKLAELIAQYVLIPERLQQSAPQAYLWLKQQVFNDIEYLGYDSCPQPITTPLSWWQEATAKVLGH
jgi:hypothetical protein